MSLYITYVSKHKIICASKCERCGNTNLLVRLENESKEYVLWQFKTVFEGLGERNA